MILTYVYSTIGYQVWRHVTPGNPNQSRDHNNNLTREKVNVIKIYFIYKVFLSVLVKIHFHWRLYGKMIYRIFKQKRKKTFLIYQGFSKYNKNKI